jgi:diaminopimelate decarboxylase
MGYDPVGLHQHIGSGWLGDDVDVFLDTVGETLELAKKVTILRRRRFGPDRAELEFVCFGGGPGIRYMRSQKDFPLDRYAAGLCGKVGESGLQFRNIAIEPGRHIVGDAGVLLLEINTVEDKGVPVIGLDGGFNDLIRPAFYGSYHEAVVCERVDGRPRRKFMVAGNLCESGDVFNENRKKLRLLPVPEEGDTLALLNAGAYGCVMASEYNTRPLPAEVVVGAMGHDDGPHVVRERGSRMDLIRNCVPLPADVVA